MKWSGQKQYEQPPAGSHLARCVSIVDLGSQLHTYQDKQEMSRDVRITFELPSLLMEGKFDPKDKGRAHGVSRTVKMSLHPKATLRKLLEGWRGKKFASKEEIDAFDPKKLIGHPARLTLVEDGDYVNLESISPINPKTDKVPKQIAKSTFFSLEPDEFDLEVFGSLGLDCFWSVRRWRALRF